MRGDSNNRVQKRIVGHKYVYELEYVYLNRVPTNGSEQPTSPFVSQTHPIECEKDGTLKGGVTLELDRVHNVIQWEPNNRTVIAPGWLWRSESVLEVPIYEEVKPLN